MGEEDKRLETDLQRFAAIENTSEAVEAERRRLAGLLQSNIVDPLNLLLSQAHVYEQTMGSNPQARMAVSVLASLARQLLQQVRDLEANLHPAILETLGLEAALETLASQEMRTRTVHIALSIERMPERLPYPVELALFRAAQDGLKQAILQLQASQVSLRLEYRDEWLILTLTDNGFGPVNQDQLSISRQHISALGGHFDSQYDPQNGSQIRISFPMKTSVELTAREMEVLQRLVEGKSNKEIAQVLGVSARTVNFHLDNIYSKLGVSSRTEAVVYALRQGLGTG